MMTVCDRERAEEIARRDGTGDVLTACSTRGTRQDGNNSPHSTNGRTRVQVPRQHLATTGANPKPTPA